MRFVAIAPLLFAAACGNAPPPSQPKAAAEAPKAVEYFHVDPATAGTIKGRVRSQFKSVKTAISMDAEAACEKTHAGHPAYDEPVIAGKDGGLANAFVYIQSGLEGKTFEPAKESVVLDQHGCMYVPRVLGIRAGQTLAVKNSDPVSHNIHPLAKDNREWSEHQAPEAPDLERRFARPEIMIAVKCDVHKWMRAYIGVVAHPYFAVTGPDGSFELRNVPPGDYTLGIWHEKLGALTEKVSVAAPAGRVEIDVTYHL
jgi:plastocyanin